MTNISPFNRIDRAIKKGDHFRYMAGHHPHAFPKGHKINIGKVQTVEHKGRISAGVLRAAKEGKLMGFPKGISAWNKGMSKENGDPLVYGKPRSDETKRKISEARIGNPLTENHKKNLSLANMGKSLSLETRKKLKEALKLRWANPEYKNKVIKSCMGRIPWNKGKAGCFTKEAITKMLTRRTPSSLEDKFQGIIDKNNLPYKFVGDGSFMIGRKNPDFININGAKIAIEVYARYYKFRHSETIEKWKENRQKVFNEYGWELVFFDETQVNTTTILQQLRR